MLSFETTKNGDLTTIVARGKVDCEHLLGKFLDESHYDILVDSDCDFYAPSVGFDSEPSERNIAFKFRKRIFTDEEQTGIYEGLIGAAGESQNRGLAAGPKGEKLQNREWVSDWQLEMLETLMNPKVRLDGRDPVEVLLEQRDSFKEGSTRGLVWLRSKIIGEGEQYEGFFDRWLEKVISLPWDDRSKIATDYAKRCVSQTSYANPVNSGIAGFFDRYPRIPFGRACSYNEKNPDKFALAFPYLRKLDSEFKDFLPTRYAAQKKAAEQIDPRFLVGGDTVFTTITVNKTFRTAAHRDAGDLAAGFSNLGVINAGKNFAGGYLVLPEYRVAINIRPGDLLLIANHDAIHGNTPIVPAEKDCCPDCLVRMSVVCYFREKMLELGSWEYEQARRDFVDVRRLNKDHPEWRPLWNGVSADMFSSQEWYDFLNTRDPSLVEKYHPSANAEPVASLESFFT